MIGNILYASSYGALSSPSGDIWFLVGVARGVERLFPTDPLQIFLPLLGFLGVTPLFFALVLLSNALHLFTLWLLFGVLVEFFSDEWAALWSCALFTLSVMGGFTFCTGDFPHAQESLPVLVGLMWSGRRFMTAPTPRDRLRAAGTIAALLLLGAILGPDVLVITTLAAPSAMLWHFRRFMDPFIRHAMGTMLLALYFTTIALAAPHLVKAIAYGAQVFRGVNLEAAQELHLGDFAGLAWMDLLGLYGPAYLIFAVLGLWAWSNGRLSELALISTGVIFATVAARFFVIAEFGFAALLCWALARPLRLATVTKHTVGAAFLAAMLCYASWKGTPCAFPGDYVNALRSLERDPHQNKLVLCTPAYGALVRAVSEAQPTSEIYAVQPDWIRIAMLPADDAIRELATKKVTHLFLTSGDLSRKPEREILNDAEPAFRGSGGFAAWVNEMPPEKITASLAYQALYGKTPLLGLTKLREIYLDSTDQRAVLGRMAPAIPSTETP
ncbi:MAG: hypothetical protein IT578_04875 [Verrucomicrobiae bacterium]|nr:hypothetical protein [Verrucomicrobiae bacterium]